MSKRKPSGQKKVLREKLCVEKCSEMAKICVEKCSEVLFLCVEKCIFAAVLCVEKCNCHGENSAKTACGMEE